MGQFSWANRPPPAPGPRVTAVWHGHPESFAELTRMRGRLRAALADGGLPAGADEGERLLLAIEELTSNGLRHGRPPVQVTITAAAIGWLLEVSDTGTTRPPMPAMGRDPALGGMGLGLVARISHAHGWAVDGDRKIVWAHIGYGMLLDRPSPERIRTAIARARGLIRGLAITEVQIAVTLQRLASEAMVEGRLESARDCRAVAARAWTDAERARLLSLAAPASSVSGSGGPTQPPRDYPLSSAMATKWQVAATQTKAWKTW